MVSGNPHGPSARATAEGPASMQVVPLVSADRDTTGQDRRQAMRLSPLGVVKLLLQLESEGANTRSAPWFPADVLDISTGGLCVLIDHHHLPDGGLCSGQPLKVNFQGHAVIETEHALGVVDAHVRWLENDASGLWCLGLAFNTPLKQLPELHLV